MMGMILFFVGNGIFAFLIFPLKKILYIIRKVFYSILFPLLEARAATEISMLQVWMELFNPTPAELYVPNALFLEGTY